MAETAAKPKTYKIIINGAEHDVTTEVVSYEQVTTLAYPTPPAPGTIYSVTFEKAKEPHEGSLVPGGTVEIKNNTEFDVTPTGKS